MYIKRKENLIMMDIRMLFDAIEKFENPIFCKWSTIMDICLMVSHTYSKCLYIYIYTYIHSR